MFSVIGTIINYKQTFLQRVCIRVPRAHYRTLHSTLCSVRRRARWGGAERMIVRYSAANGAIAALQPRLPAHAQRECAPKKNTKGRCSYIRDRPNLRTILRYFIAYYYRY